MEPVKQNMAAFSPITQRPPFRFLDLPGEIRNRIYHQALSNFVIHVDLPWPIRFILEKREWPFIGLLLACKTIRYEASYTLHRHGRLRAHVAMSDLPFEGLNFASDIRKEHKRHVDFIRNLEVDLGWLQHHGIEPVREPDFPPIDSSGATQTFCNAIADLPRLDTVTIRWRATVRERGTGLLDSTCTLLSACGRGSRG